MKLSKSAHVEHPFRIHAIASDFTVEDVWALPASGGEGELTRLVQALFESKFPEGAPLLVRFLWEARWTLGRIFRWDTPDAGLETRIPSLRKRLPDDLRATTARADQQDGPFSVVYQTDDEYVAELANRTVHTLMHLSWVPDDNGGYRGQMAVLVKPNGPLGSLYMAGIAPFRYLFVYPALLRQIGRGWEASAPDRRNAHPDPVDQRFT